MSDEKELLRESMNGEQQIALKLERELASLKYKEISNSIAHIEVFLDKFMNDHKPQDLENVYYHIGAIKGALK